MSLPNILQTSTSLIKFEGATISVTLQNSTESYCAALNFYQDGIINMSIKNPKNISEFNFYDIESRPALTPLYPHIADQTESRMTLKFSSDKDFETSPFKSTFQLIINFSPFNLDILNKEGRSVLKFNSRSNLSVSGNLIFDFQLPTHHLWGLPQRADFAYLQNHNEQRPKMPYRMHCRDSYAYKPFTAKGLYGAVPMILGLHNYEKRGLSGVFSVNPSEAYVEVNKHKDGTTDVFWCHEVGDLEIYLVVGDDAQEYFYRQAMVTGFSWIPPLWALGFHQTKMNYYYQDQIADVNVKLKEYKIPCDSIALDLEWADGFKYFSWNKECFRDPSRLIRQIKAAKRKIVIIHDPHVKLDEYYDIYQHAKKNGLLVRRADGSDYVQLCWPGKTVWLDMINQETLDYWASLYSYQNFPHSTRDVHAWNDMSEPAVFEPCTQNSIPNTVMHTFYKNGEKREVEHRYVHNAYGYCVLKGTYKGMIERDAPNKYRPFVLGRGLFIGAQKYSVLWTGDSGCKIRDLRVQIPMSLGISYCGLGIVGGDVGGFAGDSTYETVVRWYQVGSFFPYFRCHGNDGSNFKEPYVWNPKHAAIIKNVIRERYKWLYYWYACCENYVRTGFPIMRGIWLDIKCKFPVTKASLIEEEQFLLGDAALIVPVLEKHQTYVSIHEALRNEEWFTQEAGYIDDNSEPYKVGLERIGVFIRAGSILPFVDIDE